MPTFQFFGIFSDYFNILEKLIIKNAQILL